MAAHETPPRSYNNMLKNVFLLSGMSGMGLGAAFVQIPSAQNILVDNGHAFISTVPLGLIFLLGSPCAVLIPKLIARHGEKKTFVAAAISGAIGALLQMAGALTTTEENDNGNGSTLLTLMLVGASVQSFAYASSNNLRFAVAQFSTPEFLPRATQALVLFGGVFFSLLGPLLSNATRYAIPGAAYAGNFLQIAVMYLIFGLLATLTDFESPSERSDADADEGDAVDEAVYMLVAGDKRAAGGYDGDDEGGKNDQSERPLLDILRQTDLALLVFFQCLTYNIMAMYMTQVQLPMIALGYSANLRTYTITAQMIGMFAPGLVSGHIVNKLGTWAATFIGFLVFMLGGGLMLMGDSLTMFIVGMTTIGTGWNLSFVGPSAEVSKIYAPAEKSKVIGFNDGIMLLTIGISALSGSSIYGATGSWEVFNIILMGVSGFSAAISAVRGFLSRTKSSDRRYSTLSSDGFFDQLLFETL